MIDLNIFKRFTSAAVLAAVPSQIPTLPTNPYYPLNLSLPAYAANELSLTDILARFAAVLIVLFTCTQYAAHALNQNLSWSSRATIFWFVLSGSLHLFFEGYFVLNHEVMVGGQDLFAMLWKEYAKSDSRYLSGDTLVLCMEGLTTLIWGPLCIFVAILITVSHPLRHPVQIMVCVGHLYGLSLYYTTSLYELFVHRLEFSRPEPLYFWVYFVGFNIPWFVVPIVLLISSTRTISRALEALEKVDFIIKKMGAKEGNEAKT